MWGNARLGGLAGVIALVTVLPSTAAAAPCEVSSTGEDPLTLDVPARVAFERGASVRIEWAAGLWGQSTTVSDIAITATDAQGSAVLSHRVTREELARMSAPNLWRRRPLEISLPTYDREAALLVRLTYIRDDSWREPCEVVRDQTVRWFPGVAARAWIYNYGDEAEIGLRQECEQLEPGLAEVILRHRNELERLTLCSGPGGHLSLPGMRLRTTADRAWLRPIGWRNTIRVYRMDATWRGVSILTRWLRVRIVHSPGARVYRDRRPRAYRDICLGKPRSDGLPIRRDEMGRRYCRTPGEDFAKIRVLRTRP